MEVSNEDDIDDGTARGVVVANALMEVMADMESLKSTHEMEAICAELVVMIIKEWFLNKFDNKQK